MTDFCQPISMLRPFGTLCSRGFVGPTLQKSGLLPMVATPHCRNRGCSLWSRPHTAESGLLPMVATPHCRSRLLPMVATPHCRSRLLPMVATPHPCVGLLKFSLLEAVEKSVRYSIRSLFFSFFFRSWPCIRLCRTYSRWHTTEESLRDEWFHPLSCRNSSTDRSSPASNGRHWSDISGA